MSYAEFLKTKSFRFNSSGRNVERSDVHRMLFDWQNRVVRWAASKGRCAVFADTGLGKTFLQLEWARLMSGNCLIVAPLSVARQTVRESHKIDVEVKYVRHQSECEPGISITNYEMIEQFNPAYFSAVVLDESSILKNLAGATRLKLTSMFAKTPYRLCCTATPAPNDQSEIGNHAEFLGVCSMAEMLAMFFVHDEQEWRLKGHSKTEFYKWLSSWSLSVHLPSDLGFEDDGYILPPLNVKPIFVESDYVPEGELFFSKLHGIYDRVKAREDGIQTKLPELLRLVDNGEQWIVWCGLNEESHAVAGAVIGSVEIQGSDEPEEKAKRIEDFQDGKYRVMVSKPKIAGFGMNLQNCHNMIFFGMDDSYEKYYQCVRRCYRFGQQHPVNVYLLLSTAESDVYRNVMNKETVAREMTRALIDHVKTYEQIELGIIKEAKMKIENRTESGDGWTAMLGDSCERLKEIETESIGLSVYSPPFADLYTYSNLSEDLGNSRDWNEFFEHYKFIIREIYRVTQPGRVTAVHTSDIPAMLSKDGYIGLKDFPGEVIRAYEKEGWIFSGRAVIDKNPQAQAIRTKAKGLLFVQMKKDSIASRPAIGDQVLKFVKPGENKIPVTPVDNGDLDNETWISWAHMIWTDIRETETLQYTTARDPDDEKHICPLQLGTIDRCIRLWSNPGETILTPFGGIGSEGYKAVELGRKAILIELKESYYNVLVRNMRAAVSLRKQGSIFDFTGEGAE